MSLLTEISIGSVRELTNNNMLMYYWMIQVHWSVIKGIVGVQWEWKSAVKDTMGTTGAPAGSMMDFDTYCNFGFVLDPFHCSL